MRHSLRNPVAVLLWVAVGGATAPAQQGVPDLDTIVSRLEQAQAENHSRMPPYSVVREYTLVDDEGKISRGVTAKIDFLPPSTKRFAIHTGEGRARKVVGRVLKREGELAREPAMTEISRRNYHFRLLQHSPLGAADCFVLELLPRRKDKNLISGRAWVDAKTFLIRRIEGQLAKSPSWWVKNVRLALAYGPAGDVWIQTASHASADVRFLGPHVLNSRNVQVRTGSSARSALRKQGPPAPFISPLAPQR